MDLEKKLKTIKIIGIVVIIFLVLDLIANYKAMKNAPQIPLPYVITQKPQIIKMSEYVTQTGTTVAYNSVNLVARVEGYLNTISFTDGTFVKKGNPLFVIEPEPYMDKLLEAKASVAVQQANYAYTKSEYARQQHMYKENATSLNSVEAWLAKSQESAAEIDKAVANAAVAAINYGYTHVSAPFD
ncbi:MAG: biotin/lipoyl-binding protein, partial [Methylococcales bacterium]|nr:biotin/lipoyl-binding protein [Methylococcales bacterium]